MGGLGGLHQNCSHSKLILVASGGKRYNRMKMSNTASFSYCVGLTAAWTPLALVLVTVYERILVYEQQYNGGWGERETALTVAINTVGRPPPPQPGHDSQPTGF